MIWVILVGPIQSCRSLNWRSSGCDQRRFTTDKGQRSVTDEGLQPIAGFDNGRNEPWAKECRQPLEFGRRKQILPRDSKRNAILLLSSFDPSQITVLTVLTYRTVR